MWYLSTWPEKKIILASYEASFAASWGRKARDEVLAAPKELGIEVREDVAATDWWELKSGGGMVTSGVGGPVVGKGSPLILVDDPHKNWAEVQSVIFRERAWEWYRRVLYTRLEPHGSIVILMQRWHRDDLGGRVIRDSGEKWERITLPALAERDDALGRKEGEALWPVRFDRDALLKIKQGVGPDAWLAQYQQKPEEAAGDCYFNEKILSEMRQQSTKGGISQPYSPLRRYAAWIDAAGTGTDRPSLSIISWYGTQATFVVDYTTDESINDFCVHALKEILPAYGNPHIGWERNGVGEAVYQIFKAQGYPEGKIYYQDRDKGKHGVAQTGNLRDIMLVRLASGIDSRELIIPSTEAIDECLTFVKSLNGSPRAAPGAHDDRVMAMAGGLWLSVQPEVGVLFGGVATNPFGNYVFPKV